MMLNNENNQKLSHPGQTGPLGSQSGEYHITAHIYVHANTEKPFARLLSIECRTYCLCPLTAYSKAVISRLQQLASPVRLLNSWNRGSRQSQE
jgi:hypothetical protein